MMRVVFKTLNIQKLIKSPTGRGNIYISLRCNLVNAFSSVFINLLQSLEDEVLKSLKKILIYTLIYAINELLDPQEVVTGYSRSMTSIFFVRKPA